MTSFTSGVDHLLHPSMDIARVDPPRAILDADGMIDNRERKAIFRLAQEHYSGAGYIIDGGMLLGASAIALAEGLRGNARLAEILKDRGDKRLIKGYELGVLPASGPVARDVKVGKAAIRMGADFSETLEQNIAGYADLVEIRLGDLLQYNWPSSDPIEICFIDVAKTPKLNQHVFANFFPALIPGKSFVLQQDFFFDRLPWIKVLMGYLFDHFEWLGQVGCTSIYRYTNPIPREKFETDPYRDLSADERIALHRLAEDDRLPERRKFALAISLAYLLFELKGGAVANRQLDDTERKFENFINTPAPGLPVAERIARARRQFEKATGRSRGAI